MRRRDFTTMVGGMALACARPATAQTSAKTWRLGTLSPGAPISENSPNGKVLLATLAQHGYTLGGNLTYEARAAAGQIAKIPPLLQDLKASGVDAIVAIGYPPALAAKTTGIPTVVAFGVGDPVATGLIDSLAHPGGSITGISDMAGPLSAKRLSLLKELAPKTSRVAMLWNRDDLGMSLRYEASAAVARSLDITVQPLGVREPDDFEGVFEAMNRQPPDAILMVSDSLTTLNRKRVFDYAAAKRLPAIYEYDFLVRDGGLMSYGSDLAESFDRAAALVDRIFKGAKPSELPFEQPTRYPFVINLKTAKAMGLEIPPNVLARADEVIE
ncbi:ABC transporter substrate-binding protein [Reyranella soli]|uniref:ABC transporter substrate-binding protein n=1 Tax=Reyranella soli TaxID=1230389 RepID=A0A512NG71_9HYPH|nr:ABC transporter substrate-binding protein [Reyranella soli]GEP57953.1 ABC transporter substrate-binding protein [Reyranella soli]